MPSEDASPGRADQPANPERRQFFRAFGRQTAAGAGSVIHAADALRRGGSAAVSEVIGLGLGSPSANAARMEERGSPQGTTPQTAGSGGATSPGFSSAYLYTGDALVILDQRLLPERRATVTCREPSEVGAAMRRGVVGGGPVVGQLAAYALVLAAAAARSRPADAQRQACRTAADTLLAGRRGVRAVRWALERMAAIYEQPPSGELAPTDLAEPLRGEADLICAEMTLDHARLGRLALEALPDTAGRPLNLLLHGEMGPLSCGLVGTGFAIVQAAIGAGRQVHVWLTEAGPPPASGALSAFQLAQLDVPHTLIPDAAVGWLFANRTIDAVVLRSDLIRAGGDSVGTVGGLNVARLAAHERTAVFGCATTSALEPAGAGSDARPTELRLPTESSAPTGMRRLDPISDVVPAALVAAYLTEEGPVAPPYAPALARAAAARDERRAADTRQPLGTL